jgi:hypothetical protein
MGKPYKRLKYDPPENYRANGMIGHGEAVSMITDLLTPDGERRDLRRRVDNHVRYAIKQRTLEASPAGHLKFSEIAAWANKRYGKKNSNIRRMRHGEIVDVSGVAAGGEVGRTKAFGSIDDYKQELEVSQQQNERLRAALAESEAQRERERPDTDIGRKVREGGRKGGNFPRERGHNTEK